MLRAWPFGEADLLLSLFTRDEGKVRGVARHAMRSRRRFGGALEPATFVRAQYTEVPKQDVVRLDHFEILWSPLTAPVDALRLAGLQLVVEVLEEAMPEHAVDDNVFRLAVACLTGMSSAAGSHLSDDGAVAKMGHPNVGAGGVWLPVTYFCLWMGRLMGWMPALGHCAVCGLDLRGQDVWWSPTADGVTCEDDRRGGSQRLSAASVGEAATIFRSPLEALIEQPWPRERARDLLAFAVGVLERHLEKRVRSAAGLT